MKNYSLPASHIILSAMNGDPLSMSKILSHYRNYIRSLCTKNIYDAERTSSVQVDEYMCKQLEVKLIDSILKFEVRS